MKTRMSMIFRELATAYAALGGSLQGSEGMEVGTMYHNPHYRVKQPSRQLRSFTINGHTVQAYSRKDAIKRLKHHR